MEYIAEDVPWYMVNPSIERPWRDEELGMSAPKVVGRYESESAARVALAAYLDDIATFGFIVRQGEDTKFRTAATAVNAGVDGLRIRGRYYRVRAA